jgi:hypothetical protein
VNAGTEAGHLYGTTITPDVLWELTPWSWAVDWFTNAGDVINNVTNFSQFGLIMQYGYMMETYSTKILNTLDRSGLLGHEDQVPPPSSATIVSKVRREANPFGFGLSNSSLSLEQIAIAAAVGITLL